MKTEKMKLTNQESLCMKMLVMALLCIGCIISSVPAMAAAKTAVAPGRACKSGRYIYYAYSYYKTGMDEPSSGILRYDTKTKKKKRITSGDRKRKTQGFSSLSVKGNYIYAVWNQAIWGDGNRYYIYQINRKTGKKKKLAVGTNLVVVGNYIYYVEGKIDTEDDWTNETGRICRMTLTGKNKKTVKSGIVDAYGYSDISQLYVCGNEVLYSRYSNENVLYTLDGQILSRSSLKIEEDVAYDDAENVTQTRVVSGGYKYYISKAGKSLCRKNIKSGKVSKLATYERIRSFRIYGKYILFNVWAGNYKNGLGKCRGYCMKLNGKSKKILSTWATP